jgi:transposase
MEAAVDTNGLPVRLGLTADEEHDNRLALELLSRLKSGAMLLADRGYDADWIRAVPTTKGELIVAPWSRHAHATARADRKCEHCGEPITAQRSTMRRAAPHSRCARGDGRPDSRGQASSDSDAFVTCNGPSHASAATAVAAERLWRYPAMFVATV